MFQTYEAPEARQGGAERVDRLRELMAKAGLDAVLVPRADEHQGEYVPPSAERLKWLTGFSGSAGLAVVARTAAALFVDGRYVVQAPSQVDTRHLRGAAGPAGQARRLARQAPEGRRRGRLRSLAAYAQR